MLYKSKFMNSVWRQVAKTHPLFRLPGGLQFKICSCLLYEFRKFLHLALLGLRFSISYNLSALWLLILQFVELAFTCQKCSLQSDSLDSNLDLTFELGQFTLPFSIYTSVKWR